MDEVGFELMGITSDQSRRHFAGTGEESIRLDLGGLPWTWVGCPDGGSLGVAFERLALQFGADSNLEVKPASMVLESRKSRNVPMPLA